MGAPPFGQYGGMPQATTPYGGGLQPSGQADFFASSGPFGSGGSGSNPENPTGQVLPTYGGYAGGFGNTMGMEGQLAQQAQNAKAAHANFGQANHLMGLEAQYGKQQTGLANSMGKTAQQYRALSMGQGVNPADYGVTSAQSGNVAAAQAAAAGGGSPLAQRAAAAGMGQANLGVSAGYGHDVMGTMNAGAQGLTGALGAQSGVYGQMGQAGVSAAQLSAQQAQFNPGLQAQQNKVNDLTGLGYTNAGLGLQANQQTMQNNAWENENQYNLALQGLANQTNNQIMGAAGTAGGIALAAAGA
jgi:hypothetical protein